MMRFIPFKNTYHIVNKYFGRVAGTGDLFCGWEQLTRLTVPVRLLFWGAGLLFWGAGRRQAIYRIYIYIYPNYFQIFVSALEK